MSTTQKETLAWATETQNEGGTESKADVYKAQTQNGHGTGTKN